MSRGKEYARGVVEVRLSGTAEDTATVISVLDRLAAGLPVTTVGLEILHHSRARVNRHDPWERMYGAYPGDGSGPITGGRAIRDGLADDECRTRMFPHSMQILTRRQRQMETAFIRGLLLALTHAIGKPYDIAAAETLISNGACDG